MEISQFLKNKKMLIFVLLSALVVFVLAIVFVRSKGNAKNEETMKYIRTTTLMSGTITESVSSTGSVESANISNVTTSLSYVVKSIAVQEGDVVEVGDVILVLDTTELDNSIAKAEESLQSQIDKAQASYDKAYTALQDANELKTDAEDELEVAKTELNNSLIDYQNAVNSISYYQKQYDEAYALQEQIGLLLNEAEAVYRTALDDAQVIGCEFIVTEKDVTVEKENTLENDGLNPDSTIEGTSEQLTEIVVDEAAVEIKAVCEAKKEAYEQVKAEYETASADTNARKTELDIAKKNVNFDSYEKAYQDAVSKVEKAQSTLTQAEKSVTSCKESLDSAYENLEKSKTSDTLDDLKSQKSECTLRAETSGTITSMNATVGSRINGTAAVIQDTEDLIVSISISESDINNVQTGMRVIITSDATDEEIDGVLTQVSAIASTQGMGSSSSSFSAQVKVKGGSQGLKIGMNAKCEIVISETEDVFSVPLDAIEKDEDGKTYVYEKVSGSGMEMEFERVEVTVGKTNDYYAEIDGENVYAGMVVRSSAVLEEAIVEGTENQFDFGGFGNMNGMPDMSDMPNGGNFPGGSGAPSSGGMPSPGRGGFSGGN